MKKYIIFMALIAVLSLSACGNETSPKQGDNSSISPSETEKTETSAIETTVATTAEPEKKNVMETPTFEYAEATEPDKRVSLKITSSLENVDSILVYHIEADSENKNVIHRTLVGKFPADNLSKDMTVDIDMSAADSAEQIKWDNSAIQTDFHSKGYKICAVNEDDEQWSEYKAYETLLDTGTIYQYNASFYGSTACGAANGTLLLQTAAYAQGEELNKRLDVIRSYSSISDKYSCGERIDYCMSGTHIKNSVNHWLEENKINDLQIEDFGGKDGETKDIIRELIDTGRPAAVMVAYSGGNIIDEFKYGHWITINGYRISKDGKSFEFRWENTILQVDSQWDDAKTIDTAIYAIVNAKNRGQKYGISDKDMPKISRYIDALSKGLIKSFG